MAAFKLSGKEKHGMELLVATLAHTALGRDADGLTDIRLIIDIIRNAQGLVTIRSYRGSGDDAYYLMLTTWQDEESWQKAQERYNPKQLILSSIPGLLVTTPRQWLMHYLWGYNRPAAQPMLAAAHIASVRSEQTEYVRRGWIECLRRQVVQPTLALASAFLARGIDEDAFLTHPSAAGDKMLEGHAYLEDSIFLNMLNWPDETNREEFYVDPDYKAISRFLSGVGTVQILQLEPL
jgi:hypothetical protein